MVAIVSGANLGLNLGSLSALRNAQGRIGNPTQGRNGESTYVNVSSGNLVLQDVDGLLKGTGADVASLRTYNSQGLSNFTNNDGWRQGQYKSLVDIGSGVLQRTDGDGSTSTYAWDAASKSYLGTSAAGSALGSVQANASGGYTWTSGQTGASERYEGKGQGSGAGLILSTNDTAGNALAFSYDTNHLLTQVTDASGESVNYSYTGHNLTSLSTTLKSGTVANEVAYTYDSQNRLTSVAVNLDPFGTVPAGSESQSSHVTHYTYDDSSNRVAGFTQGDGTSLSFSYQRADRPGYLISTVNMPEQQTRLV